MSDHVPMGWVCPRCGRVWAPGLLSCLGCAPAEELPPILAAAPVWVATPTGEMLRTEVQDESDADGG